MIELSKTHTVQWHTATIDETITRLNSYLPDGLTDQEAKARLTRFGRNTLTEEKKEPFWEEFFEELREPMVLMLLVTGVLYAVWGELADAVTIFVIILALNTVEVVNEQRSKKAIASLRKLAEPTAAGAPGVGIFRRFRWSKSSRATWFCSRMGIVYRRMRAWWKRLACRWMNLR